MKNFKLLSVVTLVALVVVFSSCTATRGGGDYYETDARSGMYSNRGGYGNERVIIVERDPFTGRYYEVNRYGGGIFSSPYDSRYYNNSRIYRNDYRRNNGYTRNNNAPVRQDNRQTEQQREEARKKASDARDQILGPRKN